MFKSYFTIGWRSLIKQKSFSAIKIVGLAVGLATSITLYLYILEDLSYDHFHTNHDRIVRVLTIDNAEGVSSKHVGITNPRLGPMAKDKLPEVTDYVRLIGGGPYELTWQDKPVKSIAAFRADPSFFTVFDFPVTMGPVTGMLDKPGSIVITETLSKKIFNGENPIGKTVKLNGETDLNITAVIADPPKNSHLQFDVIHTLVTGQGEDGLRQTLETTESIFCRTYLLLDKAPRLDDLNTKLDPMLKEVTDTDFFSAATQSLNDVHLHSREILFDANSNKADIVNVYVLGSISALILFLAAVNFMNLATANAASRAKETGMRKVIGAVRNQLVYQHLTESVIITVIASILALGLVYTLLPVMNNLYQRFADFNLIFHPVNLSLLLGLVICLGILAGIYPAFVLSSFKPITVLKGSFKSSSQGIRLRKSLVVLQFTISIALIAGTAIVYRQMEFIFKKDLGYNRAQVITIQQTGRTASRSTTLRNELLKNSNILAAATSSIRMGQQPGRSVIIPEGHNPREANIISSIMSADDHFIPAMEMKIVNGRNFSESKGDSLSMVVNEELLRFIRWDLNTAIGKKISIQTGPEPTDLTAYTVIGVVRDFHFATIRHKLEPMFMLYNPSNNALSIRLKAGNMNETIAEIEQIWKNVNPGTTFEYSFLDEQFGNLYRNEQAFSSMFTHFSVLALIIASVGLFALAAFTAEQRKKEIGIRKVMGASNATIFYKLSSEYILLILIALPVASVTSWLVMSQWLKDFQYSITIGVDVFIFAGVLSLLVSLFTISFQALKAAFGNPINSLRNE